MTMRVPNRWNIVKTLPRIIQAKKADTIGVKELMILAFPIPM